MKHVFSNVRNIFLLNVNVNSCSINLAEFFYKQFFNSRELKMVDNAELRIPNIRAREFAFFFIYAFSANLMNMIELPKFFYC